MLNYHPLEQITEKLGRTYSSVKERLRRNIGKLYDLHLNTCVTLENLATVSVAGRAQPHHTGPRLADFVYQIRHEDQMGAQPEQTRPLEEQNPEGEPEYPTRKSNRKLGWIVAGVVAGAAIGFVYGYLVLTRLFPEQTLPSYILEFIHIPSQLTETGIEKLFMPGWDRLHDEVINKIDTIAKKRESCRLINGALWSSIGILLGGGIKLLRYKEKSRKQ